MCWVAKHFVTDVISVADDCDGLNTGGLERRGWSGCGDWGGCYADD